MISILMDCDPGHDDIFALLTAIAHPEIIEILKNGLYDLIIFTSPSTFTNFCSYYDPDQIGTLKMVSIGMTTTKAIQEAGLTCGVNGKIKIISFDAVSEAFDMMEDGLINVDIECNPMQGQLIAKIIERLEKGEEAPKVSYVEGKIFEAENAGIERIERSY